MQKKNAPAVRFAGFEGEWERKRLGECCTVKVGNDAPENISEQRTEQYNVPIYSNGIGKNILYGYTDIAKVYDECVTISARGTIGYTAYHNKPFFPIVRLLCLIPDNSLNALFLKYHLDTLKIIETQAGISQLTSPMVTSCGILHPSLSEQQKIGLFFSRLDRLITLNKQKYERLQNVKTAMLQKMFPKEGARVPEIRFSGFSGEWERKRVSDLFKITRGYVLAATLTVPTKTAEALYPVYSSQTKDNGLLGYYKDYLYENAITWTTDGANAGTVNYRAGKFYCTNVCGVLLSNKVNANQMIAEALNNVAKNYVSYVGNPKLMNNVMADIEIQIPRTCEEREQISQFFSCLDRLITLNKEKYERLQNVKTAMLGRMFV